MILAAPIAAMSGRLLRRARSLMPARLIRWAATLPPGLRRRLDADTRACGQTLLQFGRSSDEEFTALAQGLSKLMQSLTELRQQREAFQLVLEDRDADRPLASAHEIYKRSVDIVHSSIGIAVSEQDQMGGIESVLLAACGASEHFRRNQLLLRLITMSIRMEATRLEPEHQATFINVGGAIGDITQKITASTEAAFQRIETVLAETRVERGHLGKIEHDLHHRAQSSIRTIQHELTALQAALAPCAEQGRGILELLAQTGPLTLRTLAALQHQDIVRQQLEHVAAGFNDLHHHLGDSGRTSRLELGYIHHAAGVQQAHLHSARLEIETATREVVGGLEAILAANSTHVERFDAMEAAAAAAFADFRIVRMFQEEISELSLVADKSREANNNISRLVDRIEHVVRVFAEEVGHHELDVKIVALNAQVAAAGVPAAEALSRLAEETSRISDDNSAITRELLAGLQAGLTQLRSIKTSADDFLKIVTNEKNELERDVTVVTDKLTRLSARVQSDVTRVRQAFASTRLSTKTLLDRLGLAALIEQSFPPTERLCEALLSASATHSDRRDLSDEATARLDAHRDRYTMQKENAIHATAFAVAATGAVAAAANDDIELFAPEPLPENAIQTTALAAAATGAIGAAASGDIELFAPEPAPADTAPSPAAVPTSSTPTAAAVLASAEVNTPPSTAPTPATAATAADLGDGIELF
jgi:hypothetical protein